MSVRFYDKLDTITTQFDNRIVTRSFIKDFSNKIEYLYNNRDILIQLSDNCIFRQYELSWDNKAKTMFELYKNAIQNFK